MTGIEIAYALEKRLNPLAQKSVAAERMHSLIDEQNLSACRSPFTRDRDRILFCKSFRRLSHKTQLYISNEGNEHNRTRLTHSIEVAQLAKTIALNLSLNHELVEAIAYGHDVGHSPFGHAGERQINRFLKGMEPFPRRIKDRIGSDVRQEEDVRGDFRHNFQSIRVLTSLEKYHPDYEGMNLTIPCLEGIVKHTKITPIINTGKSFHFPGIDDKTGIFSKLDINKPYSTSIEGQIVSIADEIAQVTHDINDALRIGAIHLDSLLKIDSIKKVINSDTMRYPSSINNCINLCSIQQNQVMSIFHNYFSRYVVSELAKEMEKLSSNATKNKRKIIIIDKFLLPENSINDQAFKDLRKLKDDTVLNNFIVNRMDNKGEYFIRKLFDAYLNNPRQLPDHALDTYCQFKIKGMSRLGEKGVIAWLLKKKEQYKISGNFSESEQTHIISFLKDEANGHQFRLLPPQLIDNILPYLALDGDFVRVIADHIASMTDKFAQEEYEKLYI